MFQQTESLVIERVQYKLQRAVEDPDYRLKLLVEGDPDLDNAIVAALRAVELIYFQNRWRCRGSFMVY